MILYIRDARKIKKCADKLILKAILQDKFSYFKAEEGGVAVATVTDDNAEIRNLDARLFEKSTCRYTSNRHGCRLLKRINLSTEPFLKNKA